MEDKKLYLTEVFLENTLKYKLLDCIGKLELGTDVTIDIERDKNGNQISNTCLVTTKKKKGKEEKEEKEQKEQKEQKGTDKEYVIGEIPEKDSKNLLPYLEMGWGDNLYIGKVSVLNLDTNDHNKQIAIAIYVTKGSQPAANQALPKDDNDGLPENKKEDNQ